MKMMPEEMEVGRMKITFALSWVAIYSLSNIANWVT